MSTYRNDISILGNFASAMPSEIAALRRRHVERWLESLEELAPATRRGRFVVAHNFVRWCVQEGYIGRDPFEGVRSPRQPRSVPRALMNERVARTLDACPDTRARLIVMLMVQMGLRCCEVAGLQRGDVDRGAGIVRVIGKGGHERIVPVPAEAEEILDAYLAESVGSAGPLVRSKLHPQRGVAADTVGGLVVDYMKAAGIKSGPRDGVSAHALRHTAATDMLRSGAHIRDVQQVLGHAHLATTEVYMPLVVRSLADAMAGRRYLGQRRGERRGELRGGDPDGHDVADLAVHGICVDDGELESEQLRWDFLATGELPHPRSDAER